MIMEERREQTIISQRGLGPSLPSLSLSKQASQRSAEISHCLLFSLHKMSYWQKGETDDVGQVEDVVCYALYLRNVLCLNIGRRRT